MAVLLDNLQGIYAVVSSYCRLYKRLLFMDPDGQKDRLESRLAVFSQITLIKHHQTMMEQCVPCVNVMIDSAPDSAEL